MNTRSGRITHKLFTLFFALLLTGALVAQVNAGAKLSPTLARNLNGMADNVNVGTAIVAFNTTSGLNESHLNILRGIGVLSGRTFPQLGMVAMPLTAGQVRALQSNAAVRSIWSNDQLFLYMHQARVVTGVERLQTETAFAVKNGGMPVSGAGDFSVMVIDSGIDATHADLAFGTKVIQNVQTLSGTDTLEGFTPNLVVENVPNTDQSVGHGTHCAGIIGGTGVRSGSLYKGVAPGAKIIGAGLGAGLFVLNAVSAWEWGLANQARYNIRVVSNSYGGSGAFEPDNPITIASKAAYDHNMTVVFAGGNSGPGKATLNPYAKAPWVIGVAAGTKEGGLAGFSSRGLPADERLTNEDTLDDFDAPTITAPGTGREFDTNAAKFTAAMVSTRSISNIVANGQTDDTELAPAMIPFYTQISGTSMATPFVAGTVALMLNADPTLTPDEIKTILTQTASRMPGYADYEVGSGYLNAYAAVDKVFNRSRNYRNMQFPNFNAQFTIESPGAQQFHINYSPTATPGAGSVNAKNFTVAPGMNVLDVFASFDNELETGDGNTVGLLLTDPTGAKYSSGIALPILDGTTRQVVVNNPVPGEWLLEVRGVRGLATAPSVSLPTSGAALPGPVDGTIKQQKFILPTIADIQGHALRSAIEFALKNRYMDTNADGTFQPDAVVTREDFARSLALNTMLRQSLGATAKFTDVSGDFAAIAEAVTAKGSTNRDFNFTPNGMMSANATSFNPSGATVRLDLAVAFVRALGHDAEAKAKAGTTVTYQGTPLADSAQIPAALRGYAQIALDNGLFEVFPAQVVQIAPGQYQALPGPRFEPNTNVTRAQLAAKLNAYRQLFSTGG